MLILCSIRMNRTGLFLNCVTLNKILISVVYWKRYKNNLSITLGILAKYCSDNRIALLYICYCLRNFSANPFLNFRCIPWENRRKLSPFLKFPFSHSIYLTILKNILTENIVLMKANIRRRSLILCYIKVCYIIFMLADTIIRWSDIFMV